MHPEIRKFEIALSFTRDQIEVLRAIGQSPSRAKLVLMPEATRSGKPTGNMIYIHAAFKTLRRMGLTRASTENHRNTWHLTTTGAQVYEQLFNSSPTLEENDDNEPEVRAKRARDAGRQR
jgi:hypothetical protein